MPYFHQTEVVQRRLQKGKPVVNEMQRFRMLVCCLFCSIGVSLVYAFDLFTPEFSRKFNLSAGDQSTISTVGLVFAYFTVPYGFLYDYCGPFPLFVIAALSGTIGSLCLGLSFQGKITGTVATMSVFYALLNMASGLIDVAYIVTLAEAFPRNRGPVIGLAKVMTGLGSSVFASISANLFTGNVAGFIYFIMVYVGIICTTAALVVVLPPYIVNGWRRRGKTEEQIAMLKSTEVAYRHQHVPIRRLVVGYAVVAVLLIFFTVESPVVKYVSVSRGGSLVIGVMTIALVLCFFLMLLPVRSLGGIPDSSQAMASSHEPVELDEPAMVKQIESVPVGSASSASAGETGNVVVGENVDGAWEDANNGGRVDHEGAVAVQEDAASAVEDEAPQDPRYPGNIWVILRQPDIWMILIGFVCHSGLGTIVSYNASTISVALSGGERDEKTSALYTAFLGVGSAVGRVVMGLFEGYVQRQDPNNRRIFVTLALPVAPLLACFAGVLLLTIPADAILLPYIIIYFQDGAFAACNALLFPCVFDEDHGVLYNLSFVSTVVTVITFNRFLFGYSVDKKHDELGFADGEECNVAECVRTPLIILTCFELLSCLIFTVVHVRYSRFVTRERLARKLVPAEVCGGASEECAGEKTE